MIATQTIRGGRLWPESKDFFYFNALRLTEYALMVMASHAPRDADPCVCVVCDKPWLCPLTRWASEWVVTARSLGLMEVLGPLLDETRSGYVDELPGQPVPVAVPAASRTSIPAQRRGGDPTMRLPSTGPIDGVEDPDAAGSDDPDE